MEEVVILKGLVTCVYEIEGMIEVSYENAFDMGRVNRIEIPNLCGAKFGDRVNISIEKDEG